MLAAVAAALFFGGLAIRLKLTPDGRYLKGVGFLMMFLGIILFGTLLVVFSVKYLGHQKNKFHQ
jgi:hypothetical protein